MRDTNKKFFFSMDVDYVRGTEAAIEGLVSFTEKHQLDTSFFVTGMFAKEYPEHVRLLGEGGYDLGVHGWDHGFGNSGEDFGNNSYDEQFKRLQDAKQAIETVVGRSVVMNRNPNLWVSEDTFKALSSLGIKLDSSVPSGRMVGRIRNWRYLTAPRRVYRPDSAALWKERDCGIVEVPPTALGLPINLSALRNIGEFVCYWLTRMVALRSDYILFYGHPGEYLLPEQIDFGGEDGGRHARGIGPHIYDLTERYIRFVRGLGFQTAKLSAEIQ